ncbi:MAG: CocE/NonD family hydrolase [Lentisphaeria bacterium]|nr:CocE/NonD family hydrolase [Lentisphaeria bacterium]
MNAGYVVLSQDTRGRYDSEGEFKVFTEENTLDAEDGYDTVEWAAEQDWCTGKVGTFGASYDGWMQYELARLRPPHLKAMSAISIPPENTGIDWPGAFKPARRIRWWFTTIGPDIRKKQGLPKPHSSQEAVTIWNDLEQARMLALLPLIRIVDYLPEPLASQVDKWLRNPGAKIWRHEEAHQEIEVPNLDLTGWYDHCSGIDNFIGMRKNAGSEIARNQTRMIIGPWNHNNIGKRKQGDFDFGEDGQLDVQEERIRWFDFWLKDDDNGIKEEPIVRYYVLGTGEWKTAETWPPPTSGQKKLYLSSSGDANTVSGSGALVDEAQDSVCDSYSYDPYNPVPTLWDPACFYNVSDRRRLDYRQDILRYVTEALNEEIEIVGNPEFILYAASSAVDTDFFVRLIDVDPKGMAMEICYGFVRARHRNSFESEDFLSPGDVTEFRIKLGITACCFRKGHRIRVDITSSDFPNHDRNHNLGKNDLLDAEMSTAEQQVFHSSEYPSHLILPLQ